MRKVPCVSDADICSWSWGTIRAVIWPKNHNSISTEFKCIMVHCPIMAPRRKYKAFTKYLATSSTWGLSDATLEYIRYHIMSNTSSSNNDVNVTIRVKDKTSGDGIMFTIKKITKMKKVFKVYAQVKGIEESSLCFMLDGERVGDDDTPELLELEDDDQIDCFW